MQRKGWLTVQADLVSLVDEAIELEQTIKEDKKKLDQIKATLTNAAYAEMDDKNLKYMQIFGTGGHFNVAYKEKFEIDNYVSLIEVSGDIASSKIVRKEEVKFETEARFKAALIALSRREYSKEITIEQVLKGLGLDERAIKAVEKKLKGDYLKDKKVLESVGVTGEREEEIYAIRLYKNHELVHRFFGELTNEQVERVRKAVFVEDSISVGFEYEGRR